ncbi:MAG: DNA polymerase I [Myxococcales bacterium]|nr:DNA polymerase I [Myxococcales bacterium]
MARHRVVLIDGSSLVFRAFFAIPGSFSTSSGLPTNATYGFALMFRKLMAGRTPTWGACVFDAPGKTFRDDLYPEYKAQRPRLPDELAAQLPWIDKVVAAHDFPALRVPGYEADDVIGTLTRRALEAGHEVRLITGDKDFCQLVNPDVRMIDTMRDVTFDEALVRTKYGVDPDRFVDYLALVGDKVDNIPGVPGIGAKTAAKLLEQFGSLEGILAGTDQLKGKQRENLEKHAEDARLSYRLATIDQHVPLDVGWDDLKLQPVDVPKVDALYRELEFFSLLSEQAGDTPEQAAEAGDFGALTEDEAVRVFLADLQDRPAAVLPLYDAPSHAWGALAGVAVAADAERARYVPWTDGTREALASWLGDAGKPKVLHDARDAAHLPARHGVTLRGVVFDTQLASFLIDPTGNIPHELGQVARAFLHRTLAPEKDITGSGKQAQPLSALDLDVVTPWACHTAGAVADLYPILTERLEAEGQTKTLFEVDLPLAFVLAEMQHVGIRADAKHLKRLGADFRARREEVEARIHAAAGGAFNIGSPKQLGEVLFDTLGLPVIKRTKTGYSTAADVLERLAPKHDIVRDILHWRALDKLINTYTKALREAVNPADGRIHCTLQQTSGASGRLITTDPDLQRTPIRSEDGRRIREAFVPRDGWTLISADWSQIELRILAHVTEDPLLVSSFREGVDVHRRTAAQIFDVAPEAVTPEQRNVGKTVNFATIYGQGATSLGQGLGITRNEAKDIIDRYFERYAGVTAWLEATRAQAERDGYVTTFLGRRRYVTELTSNNPTVRSYGERIATNTPIQGSAADLCKLAMLRIAERLRAGDHEARMLLQIHDELLFEAPPDEVDAVVALVRDCMENAWPLAVPLVVDVGTGPSWAAAH